MPGHSRRSGFGKIALRLIVPEVVFAWLSIAARVPESSSVLPSALSAMALTEPFVRASCACGMSAAANVNITAIGWTWLITTKAFGSLGEPRVVLEWMMLPTSSRRIPATERRHQLGVAQLGLGVLDRRMVGFDRGLLLSDDRLLCGDLLFRCKPLFGERHVSAKIELPVFEVSLVASKIGLSLVELRLVRARIELGQELAFLDRLAILEVDADNLLRDHATDGCQVERRHIADPSQHDREILFLDRGRVVDAILISHEPGASGACCQRTSRRSPRCKVISTIGGTRACSSG